MKKHVPLFTLLMLFALLKGNSQNEWASKGATWYYNSSSSDYWKEGYIKIEYIGDTMIEQKECKLIQEKVILYDYIFQKADTMILSQKVCKVRFF